MKKIKYLILVSLFAIITTGCVKFNANMNIKKDKSMDFSIIYAFDKTLLGEERSLKEEEFDEVKRQGFSVEKYQEGSYEGFKITKKINNIDEVSTTDDVNYNLSGMMEASEENKYIFKVVKGEEKNTYTAKFRFDANDSGMNNDKNDDEDNEFLDDEDEFDFTSDDDEMDLSGLLGNLDLKFSVDLPYGAISTNATTKENDNKKLSWKLNATKEELIEFTFELKNNESDCNLILYIGIGVALILIILIIILLTRKNGKKDVVINDTQIEIKNDTNENVISTPTLNEKVNVTESSEQQDNA